MLFLISEFNDTKACKYKTIPYWGEKKSPFLNISPNESLFLLFRHSVVSDSVTPWSAAHQAPLFFTVSRSWLKFMSTESVMLSNHLILCHHLLLLPSVFPSIRVFSSEFALCIRWPKNWSLSFSLSPSNEHPGLISFRMGWLDLLAFQGILTNPRSFAGVP